MSHVGVDRDRNDEQAIAEVLLRYATTIDRREWDLFRTCFTSEIDAEYEGLEPWTDREAMAAFMEATHADMGHTMHRLTNMAIAVSGTTATSRTYVDALLMAPDGESGLNPIGFYDDELVLTDEGWRIRRRRFTSVSFQIVGG